MMPAKPCCSQRQTGGKSGRTKTAEHSWMAPSGIRKRQVLIISVSAVSPNRVTANRIYQTTPVYINVWSKRSRQPDIYGLTLAPAPARMLLFTNCTTVTAFLPCHRTTPRGHFSISAGILFASFKIAVQLHKLLPESQVARNFPRGISTNLEYI